MRIQTEEYNTNEIIFKRSINYQEANKNTFASKQKSDTQVCPLMCGLCGTEAPAVVMDGSAGVNHMDITASNRSGCVRARNDAARLHCVVGGVIGKE